MSKKYTPVKHKQEIIEATYQSAQYVAPIPPPNMLADYKKIDPTFADRIIKMAEEQNNASIYVNKTIVDIKVEFYKKMLLIIHYFHYLDTICKKKNSRRIFFSEEPPP